MSIRKPAFLSCALLVAVAAAQPAFAQTAQPAPAAAAQMEVGAQVSDTSGGAIGTITSVDGAFVVLKTDRHEVRLPATSFTRVDNGYIMGMTQAEVNAAADQSLAEAAAKIAVGATVRGSGGVEVGTIGALDAQFVTLKTADGLVKLPREGVGVGPDGPVIGLTAAELKAAVSAAGGAAPDAPVE